MTSAVRSKQAINTRKGAAPAFRWVCLPGYVQGLDEERLQEERRDPQPSLCHHGAMHRLKVCMTAGYKIKMVGRFGCNMQSNLLMIDIVSASKIQGNAPTPICAR